MFRKWLAAVGVGAVAASGAATAQPREPHPPADAIYNLLFCDDLAAFQPKSGGKPADWQVVLFGPAQDPAKISVLAQDGRNESRVRALAFTWLRAHGRQTPKGMVLGLVMEIPVANGLDVLAAYADGSVRYINHSGKMAIVEPGGLPEANSQAKRLIELSQSAVARIGPWDQARRPPPANPNMRLTWIVSDGLYFGEGPFELMQRDPLAAPFIQQGAQLLAVVVKSATAQ